MNTFSSMSGSSPVVTAVEANPTFIMFAAAIALSVFLIAKVIENASTALIRR